MKNGGTMIDNEKVEKIIPGETITVKSMNREIKARKIIITSGELLT